MAKKIDFGNVLNKASLAERVENTSQIKNIDIDKIITNKRNFYELSAMEELKHSIEDNGLFDNLVVNENGDGTFLLISGHRRYEAIKQIHAEDPAKFNKIPCKVYSVSDEDEKQWLLLEANAHNRVKSDYEIMKEIEQRKEIYEKLKAKGHRLGGRVRELVAADMKLGFGTVQRYEALSKNITPQLEQAMKEHNLKLSQTNELASLEPEKQKEKINQLKHKSKAKTVKVYDKDKYNLDREDGEKLKKVALMIENKGTLSRAKYKKYDARMEKISRLLGEIEKLLE